MTGSVRPITVLVFAVFLLALAGDGYSFSEPEGFRGVKWGATLDEARAKLPRLRCGAHTCFGDLDIAGRPVIATLEFRDGGLSSVQLRFDSSRFGVLKPIFIERYGEPTRIRSETAEPRMGARLENEILEWSGEKAYVRLQRYAGRMTDGSARIMTQASRAEELRKFQDQLRKGKDDL